MTASTAIPTARELIAHFGGPSNLVRLAEHHRIEPCPNTEQAKKWKQRNSLPHDYALALVGLGDLIGKPVDLLGTTHHGAST
jgi:hypothetical protein